MSTATVTATNNQLELALSHARAGRKVFPCLEADGLAADRDGKPKKAKSPYPANGFLDATTDEMQIRSWWSQWASAAVGFPAGANGYVVIDVDLDKNPGALEQLHAMGDIPETYRVRTPRGGVHLYFNAGGVAFGNSTGGLPSGVDVRGSGYVLAAGSVTEHGEYTKESEGVSPAAVPEWLENELQRAVAAPGMGGNYSGPDPNLAAPSDDALRALIAALPNDERFDDREAWVGVGHAIWGAANGDVALAAEVFSDFSLRWLATDGLQDTDPAEKMYSDISRRQPRIGWDWLTSKGDYSARCIAAQHEFGPPSDEDLARAAVRHAEVMKDHPLHLLNERFVYLLDESGTVYDVGAPEIPGLPGRDGKRISLTKHFYNDAGAVKLRWVETNGRGKDVERAVSAARAWSEWKSRRTGVMVFDPKRQSGILTPRVYRPDVVEVNEFAGWGYDVSGERPSGDYGLFDEHIRENVCGGDGTLYAWLMDWFADMFQNPTNRPGTHVCFRSEDGGTGKTIVAKWLARMVGPHAVPDATDNELTGSFNERLSRALFVVFDEVLWGGNVSARGPFKRLCDSAQWPIRRKFLDSVSEPNNIRVACISNEDRPLPLDSATMRRVLFLTVGTGRREDTVFFGKLDAQMEKGGAAALLWDLMHRKIASNLRDVPRTESGAEARDATRVGWDAWFAALLDTGDLPIERLGSEAELRPDGSVAFQPTSLREAFNQSQKDRHQHLSHVAFPAKLRRWASRTRVGETKKMAWRLPPLPEVRREWADQDRGNHYRNEWADADAWTLSSPFPD